MAKYKVEMKVDVPGRVRNTQVPTSNVFLPLFEAVVNSIHATEERFGEDVAKKGFVDLSVHRVLQKEIDQTGRPPVPEVQGFTVRDNGCGFTDANLQAFCTADTTSKANLGGKGVGRFTWLVVFNNAKIQSVYAEDNGALRERTFAFRPTNQGIEDYTERDVDKSQLRETIVELTGVKSKKHADALRVSADLIAERLFEHCFNYFVVGKCPRIRLIEQGIDGTMTIDINEKLSEVSVSTIEPLVVGIHSLSIVHAQQKHSQGRKHLAHLCAHQRVVTSFPLSEVSDLDAEPIVVEDGQRIVHHAFVSGQALDDAVDSTRTTSTTYGWSTIRYLFTSTSPRTCPSSPPRLHRWTRTDAPTFSRSRRVNLSSTSPLWSSSGRIATTRIPSSSSSNTGNC